MASSFTVRLNVAGHEIQSVSMNWGLAQASGIRSQEPSYGTDIEVPAVIQILNLIASGAASAEEARDCLNHMVTAINQEMDRQYSHYLSFDEDEGQKPPKEPVLPQPPVLDTRWVYAVSSEADQKAIKIGVAQDIAKRLRALQVGSASPIVLRWSARGGYALERHLHETFAKKRISGEWFDFRRVANPVEKIAEAANVFLKQFETDQPDVA